MAFEGSADISGPVKTKEMAKFLCREPPDVAIPFGNLTINTETDIAKNVSHTLEYVVERAGIFSKRGV